MLSPSCHDPLHWALNLPPPIKCPSQTFTPAVHALLARRSRRLAAQSLQDRLEAAAEVAAVAAAVEAAQRNRSPPMGAGLPPPPPGPGSAVMQPQPASAPAPAEPAAPPPTQTPFPQPPTAQAPVPQPPAAPPAPVAPSQQPPLSPPPEPPSPSPPPRPPWPPAMPYQWAPLDATQRRRADNLITVFENASLEPQCERRLAAQVLCVCTYSLFSCRPPCWHCRGACKA